MAREVGQPGWAGQGVRLMQLDQEGNPIPWATVLLDDDGLTVLCDSADLLSEWERMGIIGRATSGILFPRDGRRFLDELPFVYKSAYCFAEPLSLVDGQTEPQ